MGIRRVLSAVKPSKSLHLSRFRAPKIYFPDLVSFAVLGFLISGVRKLLTWATFWISDFAEDRIGPLSEPGNATSQRIP